MRTFNKSKILQAIIFFLIAAATFVGAKEMPHDADAFIFYVLSGLSIGAGILSLSEA